MNSFEAESRQSLKTEVYVAIIYLDDGIEKALVLIKPLWSHKDFSTALLRRRKTICK